MLAYSLTLRRHLARCPYVRVAAQAPCSSPPRHVLLVYVRSTTWPTTAGLFAPLLRCASPWVDGEGGGQRHIARNSVSGGVAMCGATLPPPRLIASRARCCRTSRCRRRTSWGTWASLGSARGFFRFRLGRPDVPHVRSWRYWDVDFRKSRICVAEEFREWHSGLGLVAPCRRDRSKASFRKVCSLSWGHGFTHAQATFDYFCRLHV